MKQEVKVTTSTQTAIPELKRPEKTIYFLIIGEADKQVVITIGKGNYDAIKSLEKTSNE